MMINNRKTDRSASYDQNIISRRRTGFHCNLAVVKVYHLEAAGTNPVEARSTAALDVHQYCGYYPLCVFSEVTGKRSRAAPGF
jgi:hypothetical protein